MVEAALSGQHIDFNGFDGQSSGSVQDQLDELIQQTVEEIQREASSMSTTLSTSEASPNDMPSKKKKYKTKKHLDNDIFVELFKHNAGVRVRANSIETFGTSCQIDLADIINAQHLVLKLGGINSSVVIQ